MTNTEEATAPASPEVDSPLGHLSAETLDRLAEEFDAIHDEVYASLGEKDRKYIKSVIAAQRQLVVAGRVILFASSSKPAWVAGTACLGMAKILENISEYVQVPSGVLMRCPKASAR